MAQILDGKLCAENLKLTIQAQVSEFCKQFQIQPTLATILVGEDPASHVYVRNKIKSTEACGMRSLHLQLPATLSQADLLKQIQTLNADAAVHGILVQLPLPAHIDSNLVIAAIDPNKDVDGFHPINVGRLSLGQTGFVPCTPLGVMQLLQSAGINVSGVDALVIGKSNIVGKPMAHLLLAAGATVTIAHSKTKDLAKKVAAADLVVAAVGRPNLIAGDCVKPGAIVIDVGINRMPNGKLCGDVDFELAKEKASHITPVPGGVGPMTIAMLMQNTLTAAKLQVGKNL